MTEQGTPSNSDETLAQQPSPHRVLTELYRSHARPKIVSGGRASAFLRFTQELTCTIPSERGERVIKIVTHGKPHQPESARSADYRVEDTQNPGLFINVEADGISSVVQDCERGMGEKDQGSLMDTLQSMLSDINNSNTYFTSEYKVDNPSNVTYFHTTRDGDTIVFDVPRMRIGPKQFI